MTQPKASLKFRGHQSFGCPFLRLAYLTTFALILFLSTQPAYAAQVTLAWEPNTESDLSGYKLYYGKASRNYPSNVNVGNQTSYTISGLEDGMGYFFAATAYNTSNVESNFSEEVSYTTPPACTYSISPTSQSFNASGGTGSVTVTTQSGCSWTVTNNCSWVTITSGSSGTGSGTVSYLVSANTSSASRSVTINIAGQTFTITQEGVKTYTISATASTGGTITPSGQVTVSEGTSQSFAITPNSGYHVADVKVDGVSQGGVSSYTFTNVIANHTIEASFASNPTYTLSITKAGTGSGTVTSSPSGTSFPAGTVVTLTATPDASSTFAGWSGGASGTSPTTTVTMNQNTTVTATFTLKTYTITATAGTGGTISPSGSVTVNYGTSKSFTITPNSGYTIADVKVDGVSQGGVSSYTFTNVTATHTINATFSPITYTLTISKTGTGSGTVTTSPAGTTFNAGTVVTLTATPDASSIFSAWSGGASGTSPTTTVTMNQNTTVTATFTLKTYTITATAGTGGTISPTGSVTVNYGTSQSFTITPNSGYYIADVKVDGVSQGAVSSYTFTNVTANHTIDASFTLNPTYTLSITKAGTGSGTVTNNPSGTSFPAGTVVTLTATPDASSTFAGWSGGASGTSPTTTVTINQNITVTATFTLKTYTITATAGTGGTISPSGQVTVNYGNTQTFAITPNTGYTIADVKVDGVSQGGVSSYTFTNVTANHTIDASFTLNPTYTLSITKVGTGTGTVTNNPSGTTFPAGTVVTLTATPNASSTFAGWSGGASGTSPTTTVTMNQNITVTATFTLKTYTITATAGTGGTISPLGSITVNYGASQSFSITPNSGYTIASVKVDGVSKGTVSSYTFTNVTANHTIKANFSAITYTLTITKNGTGSGTVTTNPSGTSFNAGTVVTLTAAPNANSVFSGWSGGASGSSPTTTITMNQNTSVTATFTLKTYTITATAGTGGTISPSGSVTVNYGTSQSFAITPNSGYYIADVKVDGVSQGAVSSYTFTNVTANHTIDASFTTNPTYTLSITKEGTGSGTVTNSPSGTSFPAGTVVTLTATPDASSTFAGWSGGVTGTSPTCTVTTNADTAVTATFTLKTYTITATAGTDGTISPSGSITVDYGTSQSFSITPNSGYYIADVKVDGVSQGAVSSYTFTNVTADHSIEASFNAGPPPVTYYTLTITKAGNGSGTVTNSPSGTTFSAGTVVTLTAKPDKNSTFKGWSGGVTGTSSTCSLTMNADTTVTATFMLKKHVIRAMGETGGSLTPAGSVEVTDGENQEFIVTPDEDYKIVDIKVDGVSQGAVSSYTFINVDADHIIEAIFDVNTPCELTVSTTKSAVNGEKISISASGGTSPYVYKLITATPTGAAIDPISGDYLAPVAGAEAETEIIQVIDANGCVLTSTVKISPAAVAVTTTGSGTVSMTINGPADATYAIDSGVGSLIGNVYTSTEDGIGVIKVAKDNEWAKVIIKVENGICLVMDTVPVQDVNMDGVVDINDLTPVIDEILDVTAGHTIEASFNVNTTNISDTPCELTVSTTKSAVNGEKISISASGGTSPYVYKLITATPTGAAIDPISGDYLAPVAGAEAETEIIQIIDANGCVGTSTVKISPAAVAVTTTGSGTASVTINGPTGATYTIDAGLGNLIDNVYTSTGDGMGVVKVTKDNEWAKVIIKIENGICLVMDTVPVQDVNMDGAVDINDLTPVIDKILE